jgi:tetrapyrrole methylase family protein/MazG family protein
MSITILGLGPGDATLLTRAAWDLLEQLDVLYLRTAIHPTVAALPPRIALRPFDALYESASDFAAVYDRIAAELVGRAQAGEQVVYAVPGHPLVAEATTRRLLALAREHGLSTRIVAGLSFVEPVCEALELDPLEHGLQLIDALDLIPSSEFSVLSPKRPFEKPSEEGAWRPATPEIFFSGGSSGGEVLHAPPFQTVSKPPESSPQNSNGAWSEIQGIGPYMPALLPFPLTATRPALICQLYSRAVASHVKLSLLERYPAEHPVTLVRAAGVAGEQQVWQVPLHALDHQRALDHLTCAFVPQLAPLDDLRGPEGIGYVVARLLGPNGCPWDREQTHQSLRPELLEEAYEVLEALDADDMAALSEELGDLLLSVLMHSEMARQAGDFSIGEVYEQIATKLIRRHPHVFGAVSVGGSADVLRNWDTIKQEERAAKGQEQRGALDGIPVGLPALAVAQELTHKAAKQKFDWPTLGDTWAKLDEELAELREAAALDDAVPDRERRLADELGDVLFAASNLARRLHVDAESALRMAGNKFRRRFSEMERRADARQRRLRELDIAELLALWAEAKTVEE